MAQNFKQSSEVDYDTESDTAFYSRRKRQRKTLSPDTSKSSAEKHHTTTLTKRCYIQTKKQNIII